jgi:hypothetical protein
MMKAVIGDCTPKPRFTNSCDNPLSMMIMGGGSCNGHGTAELFHPKNISSTSPAAVVGLWLVMMMISGQSG